MNDTQQVKTNKYLLKITIPVFIEMLFGVLMGYVDQLMISGQSENAFAAIGNSNQIINLFIITFNVVAMASTIMISQYIGAKNSKKAEQLYTLALIVNISFGVIISIILTFFNRSIFGWLNCPPELIDDAVLYTTIIGGGLILNSIFITFSAFLKSNGWMKDCMYIAIISNVVNIFGNALLIYGPFGMPKLGIAGVAISSNFSKLVAVILIILMYKKHVGVKVSLKKIKPLPFDLIKRMFGIGVPSAGENISWNLSMVVIQKIANKFGTNVVKARVTVNLLSFVSWILANAVSTTTQIIVGYLVGAKDYDGIEKRYKSSLKMAMLFSLIGSLILIALSKPVCGIFIDSPEVLDLCQKLMIVDLFLEQGRAVNLTAVRSLQACGDTKFPIIIGIIDQWLVAVGVGFILAVVFHLGIIGIWIGMASDEIIRAIIFTIRWNRGKWRHMKTV